MQSRHQRFIVNLRFEDIDTDKDERKDATETKNPFVLPTYVCYRSRQRKEERIPMVRIGGRSNEIHIPIMKLKKIANPKKVNP